MADNNHLNVDLNYWKSKFEKKSNQELVQISNSESYQESARVAALNILKDRGADFQEVSIYRLPQILTRKDDLKFLLDELIEHGYRINFNSSRDFNITRGSSYTTTAILLFLLGMILFCSIVFLDFGAQMSLGKQYLLFGGSLGMIVMGSYRYFHGHAFLTEIKDGTVIVEGYVGSGRKGRATGPINEIVRFDYRSTTDQDERLSYEVYVDLGSYQISNFLMISQQTGRLTEDYVKNLVNCLNKQVLRHGAATSSD